ncbi:hypothetical protein DSO57_1036907 [Entomophthora muscae]|uniref:Uncharacterized protein n=1 Tax=Entomophthora muscae TaxID=34485 RepID=A0ACC2SZ55_9FUNG|nr:hypothetical protein DSO57_1036907 [Entomophthora muscae]
MTSYGWQIRPIVFYGQQIRSMVSYDQQKLVLRIDISSPLETRAQEWDSNPDPGLLQVAGPMDQGPPARVFLRLSLRKLKPLLSPKARIPAQV